MKIVDAPKPKSKAAQIENMCKSVCGKQQSVYIEFEKEKRYFCKVAQRLGFKTKAQIQSGMGGWLVWVWK